MSFLAQNQNQFAPTQMLGGVSEIPTPDVVSCKIDPAYNGTTPLQNGSPVKLLATTAAGEILVAPIASVTDGPVFGYIAYSQRGNTYGANDMCEVACGGSFMWMRSSAAIARGAQVATTPATTSSDPLVTTDTTSTHFASGNAMDVASAADQLIRVKIVSLKAVNP